MSRTSWNVASAVTAVPADVSHSLLSRARSATGALRQTEAAGSARREFPTAENRGRSSRATYRAPTWASMQLMQPFAAWEAEAGWCETR